MQELHEAASVVCMDESVRRLMFSPSRPLFLWRFPLPPNIESVLASIRVQVSCMGNPFASEVFVLLERFFHLLSIYLGRFPQFGGLPTTQKKQQKQWGFHSVLPAMTRDPAEFGWHCWSNTAHPPPSSTTYVAS